MDFTRFNSHSFEHLVRALAFAELGPGGSVFSPGPDGARDFVYEGKISKFEARNWNGYLIIQSKFRETLRGPTSDIAWLEKELEKELNKFLDLERNLRKPSYYIIASNIGLSGVDDRNRKGGHRKISDALDKWKSQIGLKDFVIWHADQIYDLLKNHTNIRQSFSEWLTPSDVIARLVQKIPSFPNTVRFSVKAKLVSDQYVALNESGDVEQKKIPTSKVFIDLPIGSQAGTSDEGHTRQREMPGFVKTLIERAKIKFDPSASFLDAPNKVTSPSNRIVLLAGPGQGKSTTGLFAVQLFRAAYLSAHGELERDPVAKDIVEEILNRSKAQNLSIELPLRIPIHISLPKYADLLSVQKKDSHDRSSLLNYIAQDLSRSADISVESDDVRQWLSESPWLFVFDGLDEVPPSGERSAILEAITRFLSVLADASADAVVVVTSRPQGYNHDLDPRYWEHMHLADLPEQTALQYAEALSVAQHPHNLDRRDRIMNGLRRALMQSATKRLMISPLQITIMHLIIDGGGSAPAGRWALFNEYYQVLKKRERGKGGGTQAILEKNWDHLDPIHFRAGMVLQTKSETSGNATSSFTLQDLRNLISEYLESQGYRENELKERANDLSDLALNRLVLLSMKQQGKTNEEGSVSFDVRSLQEFMAAAEITTEHHLDAEKRDTFLIEDRLLHIGRLSHWRHVFLIAASRCFSEIAYHKFRSLVGSIPRKLDLVNPDRLARTGAKLALEMLSDGVATTHPITKRELLDLALRTLDFGAYELDTRLLSLRDVDSQDLFDSTVEILLQRVNEPAYEAAWKLLVLMADAKISIANDLIKKYWPNDVKAQITIVRRLRDYAAHPSISRKALKAFRKTSPIDLMIFSSGPVIRRPHLFSESKVWKFLTLGHQRYSMRIKLLSSRATLDLLHVSNAIDVHELSSIDGFSADWNILIFAQEFSRRPSAETLGQTLELISSRDEESLNRFRSHCNWLSPFSWLLQSILIRANSRAELIEFATLARMGFFGDLEDWRKAEERWERDGISVEDLMIDNRGFPFDRRIGTVGAPYLTNVINRPIDTSELVRIVVQTWPKFTNKYTKACLAFLIQYHAIIAPEEISISPKLSLQILEALNFLPGQQFFSVRQFGDTFWADDNAVQRLDFLLSDLDFGPTDIARLKTKSFLKAIERNPHCANLLTILIANLLGSKVTELQSVAALISGESFKKDNPREFAYLKAIECKSLATLDPEEYELVLLDSKSDRLANLRLLAVKSSIFPIEDRIKLSAKVLDRQGEVWSAKNSFIMDELRKLLDQRKSDLRQREVWIDRLVFPEDAFRAMTSHSLDAVSLHHPP